ncbi:hypothetical protein K438DRAFT_1782067 [Mycena galopus ATCC 62051]|nr:hypothetical protein K438DRAFT_1782067 [Mycena galopus ATCC 62051]
MPDGGTEGPMVNKPRLKANTAGYAGQGVSITVIVVRNTGSLESGTVQYFVQLVCPASHRGFCTKIFRSRKSQFSTFLTKKGSNRLRCLWRSVDIGEIARCQWLMSMLNSIWIARPHFGPKSISYLISQHSPSSAVKRNELESSPSIHRVLNRVCAAAISVRRVPRGRSGRFLGPDTAPLPCLDVVSNGRHFRPISPCCPAPPRSPSLAHLCRTVQHFLWQSNLASRLTTTSPRSPHLSLPRPIWRRCLSPAVAAVVNGDAALGSRALMPQAVRTFDVTVPASPAGLPRDCRLAELRGATTDAFVSEIRVASRAVQSSWILGFSEWRAISMQNIDLLQPIVWYDHDGNVQNMPLSLDEFVHGENTYSLSHLELKSVTWEDCTAYFDATLAKNPKNGVKIIERDNQYWCWILPLRRQREAGGDDERTENTCTSSY